MEQSKITRARVKNACADGVIWHVIPENFRELMSKLNAGKVLSKPSKIIIEEYFN